jgi:hypothetical protein
MTEDRPNAPGKFDAPRYVQRLPRHAWRTLNLARSRRFAAATLCARRPFRCSFRANTADPLPAPRLANRL